jgi:hypothetical protein
VVARFLGGTLTCFCRPCWGLVGSTLLGPEGTSTCCWVWLSLDGGGLSSRRTARGRAPGLCGGVVVGAAVSGDGGLSVL